MRMRKLAAATLLTLGFAGGLAATQGVASAATFVPGGVYTSSSSCAYAGNVGMRQHRWVGWYCLKEPVQPRPVPTVGAAAVLIRCGGAGVRPLWTHPRFAVPRKNVLLWTM